MSNFSTFAPMSPGIPGTAPQVWLASTADSFGTITGSGYLNDITATIKKNDVVYINYSDTSVYPLNVGEASTFGIFLVTYSAPNWGLTSALSGLGQAAAKDVTDNTKSLVASVTGTFVVNDLVLAADTAGTIKPAGFNTSNLLLHTSVAVSAAQWNGMYATPVQLIAAPGAGVTIVVVKVVAKLTYGTTQFAAGGVVAAQYDSTVHGAGALASATQQASDFNGATASTLYTLSGASGNSSQVLTSASSNKGIYLSNQSGAFTTGDSTFSVTTYYELVAA